MATRSYSGSIAATGGYTNQDGSGVTKFNLYYTVTQDLAANTSTINWQVYLAGGGSVWYMTYNRSITLNGSSVYSNSTRTKTYVGEPLTGMSGSLTVNHSSDGTHAAIPVSWQAGVCQTTKNCESPSGASIPLTTIPRATTPTISAVTIGSAPTFDFSARADSSYTHTVTYTMGSDSGTVVTKTANATYSSWTAPAKLAKQIPNATSGTITFTCETFNGNTSLGTTTVTATATVPNTSAYKPSTPTATYENTTKSYLSGIYLASLSAVKVTGITATANGGATIVSYSTTFNGATYTGTSFTTATPSSAGPYTMRVTVTDSRGRTNYRDYTITYYAYSPPTLTATASRSDSNGNADEIGNYAKFAITGAATSVKGSGSTEKNSISGKIQYKQSTASSYTTVNISGSGLNLTYSSSIEMSADYAWDIIVSVTDGANKTVSKTMKLSIGYATMDFYDGGKGIAFGTTATKNGFECAMDAEFTGGFKANGVRLLEGTTTIANGTNLNTLTTLGEYVVYDAGARTCTNTPWGTAASNNAQAFRLTVERSLRSVDSYLRQTLFPYSNANGYKRLSTNSGSTWTGWIWIQADLGSKASLASPTFTGTPKAPTAASGTNTTQIATTAFVQAALLQNVLTTTALEASTSSITSASSNGSNRVGDFKGGFIRIGDLVFVSFYCKALMNLAAADYWTIARGFPKAWATAALSASFFKTKGAMNGYINTDGELLITLDSYSVATGEYICVSGFYIAQPVTTT